MIFDKIIPITIVAALFLVPNLRFLYVKLRYVKVNAVCASVNYHQMESKNYYQPIWEYDYDGTTYYSCKRSSSREKYEIGEKAEIYICPKKPNRIYTGSVISIVVYDVIVLIMILIEALLISL